VNISKKMLIDEIKTLKKASSLHAKYSISQYKKVLKILDELAKEKEILEQKVKQRTVHLEKEVKQKEHLANKLEKVAKYDQLTGLANRYLFLNELKIIHEEANLLNKKFVLLFIDLDGFKLVNDTYGHEVGDILLQTVASRIRTIVRKDDMVARLGGDEFTLILRNMQNREKVTQIASQIINIIKEVIKIDSLDIYVGSSIGIYVYDDILDHNFHDIISKADIAMYEAKKIGKGTFVFFDASMQEDLHNLTLLKQNVKSALKDGEFINFFQPIVTSNNYNIKGFEVLIRWYKDSSIISPEIFIPILEDDIHLITEVTFWQIEYVIKLLRKTDMFFSINISAKLLNFELIKKLKELQKKYNFSPSQIYFEVTETSLSSNILQASKVLSSIKSLGFNLSLDDFGTGYSSLAYLRELSFDTLKIDKKFIDNILQSKKDKKLLEAIINMAKTLNMKIVLEGVETKEQVDILQKDLHIKYQGFYFYRPLEYKDFLDLL